MPWFFFVIYLLLQACIPFVVFQTKVAHLCFCLVRIKMSLLSCFACFGRLSSCLSAVLQALCLGPARHLSPLFYRCFQGPAFGASVAGRADRIGRKNCPFKRHQIFCTEGSFVAFFLLRKEKFMHVRLWSKNRKSNVLSLPWLKFFVLNERTEAPSPKTSRERQRHIKVNPENSNLMGVARGDTII